VHDDARRQVQTVQGLGSGSFTWYSATAKQQWPTVQISMAFGWRAEVVRSGLVE